MTDDPRWEERLTPAEERLLRYLLLLSPEAAPVEPPTTEVVMRTVRWQYALRHVIHALASVAGGLLDGLSLLLGRGGPTRR